MYSEIVVGLFAIHGILVKLKNIMAMVLQDPNCGDYLEIFIFVETTLLKILVLIHGV